MPDLPKNKTKFKAQTGRNGAAVELTGSPDQVVAGETANFSFEVDVKSLPNIVTDGDVKVSAFLYVNGTSDTSIVASKSTDAKDNEIVRGVFSHQFKTNDGGDDDGYPRTNEPIAIKVEIRRTGTSNDVEPHTRAVSVEVQEPVERQTVRTFESGGSTQPKSVTDTFTDRTDFAIKQIRFEDDAEYLTSVFGSNELSEGIFNIEFEYGNPSVSIDTAGRFAKHEIIGGAIVRQKIGEEPIQISVDGVCKRDTANQIDTLRDARDGLIFSDRLPGYNDSLRVQFGSTKTQPLTDGGAADLEDGRSLYTFQINCIEVIR